MAFIMLLAIRLTIFHCWQIRPELPIRPRFARPKASPNCVILVLAIRLAIAYTKNLCQNFQFGRASHVRRLRLIVHPFAWAIRLTIFYCCEYNKKEENGQSEIRTRGLLHAKEAIYRADLSAHIG